MASDGRASRSREDDPDFLGASVASPAAAREIVRGGETPPPLVTVCVTGAYRMTCVAGGADDRQPPLVNGDPAATPIGGRFDRGRRSIRRGIRSKAS
jgi:hypothetical protein